MNYYNYIYKLVLPSGRPSEATKYSRGRQGGSKEVPLRGIRGLNLMISRHRGIGNFMEGI